MSEQTITKDMTIGEIFTRFPQKAQHLAHVLTKANLNCVGCCSSQGETLEAGVFKHGYDEDILEKILGQLNEVLKLKVDDSECSSKEACDGTVEITELAAQKIFEYADLEEKSNWYLRFDEVAAGCSGYEYVLEFCNSIDENDKVIESKNVKIAINRNSLKRLNGSIIDFVEGLHCGFKIINPNAKSSCGCGDSHNY